MRPCLAMRAPSASELRFVPRRLRTFLEQAPELHPFTLEFREPALEAAYQDRYFEASLPYVRLAHLMGIALWAIFGGLALLVIEQGRGWDLFLRFGVAIPATVASLAVTYTPGYRLWWRGELTTILLFSAFIWGLQRALVVDARPDWGYAGLMLILAFTYVVSRLQLTHAAITGVVMIVYYNVISIAFTDDRAIDTVFADYFLLALAGAGMAAAYGLERSARLLFLRERELDRERHRSETLLRNILPRAIVERLKARQEEPEQTLLADGLPGVTVLFADLVGFTQRAGTISPETLIGVLDGVFGRFDGLAAELGIEKIKTVGDAYMAVAGAPEPRPDHAQAAAEMALGILRAIDHVTWPTGEPMQIRGGVATGPAVAGVIGRERFAYDLWGDTVNLASRLESNGQPNRVLMSDATFEALQGQYSFDEPCTVNLKGKGPTRAHFLRGRIAAEPQSTPTPG
jgi:class 3 adenylate cyclase